MRLAGVLLLAAVCACDRPASSAASNVTSSAASSGATGSVPPVTGQWIWSARDSALLVERRVTIAAPLRAGVWIASINWRGNGPEGELATSLGRPLDATVGNDAELVIRLEDSFSAIWRALPADSVAARLDARLERVLAVAERGGPPHTVQLDYDAPVSRLAAYAALVQRLRAPGGALHGRSLWITSLVAHLGDPEYGARLRPHVDGHIVQLFDTGDRYTPDRAREVLALVSRAGLPFRVGVGAFERRLASGPTSHRAWFEVLPSAAQSPWYRGVWIFPGGVDYQTYLPR